MRFWKQLLHSTIAVSAIILIVVVLMLVGAVPYNAEVFVKFLIGAGLLILGQTIFLLAIDGSIIKVGRAVGSELMKRKNIWYILLFGFLFGFVSTIAEPDVQVLVNQIIGINSFLSAWLLLSIIGFGCGMLVCFGLVRILVAMPLKWLLLIIYGIILILCFFVPECYIGISFDAGGVTTGGITVPFILALTIGICAIRGKNSKNDSFGVIAITSTGPIIAILILGIIFGEPTCSIEHSTEVLGFLPTLLAEFKDVGLALIPLILIFIISQILIIKMPAKQVWQIIIGFVFTGIGLVVFLTGIYYGFAYMGQYIGSVLLLNSSVPFIFVFGLVVGFCIVFTDPATIVLATQVEEVTSGLLKRKIIFVTLGIGVGIAVCIALFHVIFHISLFLLLIPLYVLALVLNFFIPKIFTAIAFDSGGIASGTMAVAFILPIFLGLSSAIGGDTLLYGFGIIGLIATVPIITVQILGLIYKIKSNKIQEDVNNG